MHRLQQHILKEITLTGPRRFTELKPKSIEGNKFVYHLHALIREGYVAPHKNAYILTAAGKRYAERMSLESYQERVQPKIVTLLVLKNKQGEYLLYKRRRVPFRNMVSFPYGKMHLGERVEDAAARELIEKTGLSAVLTFRGSVYLAIHDEEEIVSHMLCHVFTGKKYQGDLRAQTPAGDCFWGNPYTLDTRFCMPGTQQVLKQLQSSKKNFFAEYFLDVHEEPFDSN